MHDTKRRFLQDLFLRHARELRAFVRGRWPGEPDADDIIQESFLRLSLYPAPETLQNPRAFLFQTASNLVVDQHRRRALRDRYADPEAEPETLADPGLDPERWWQARQVLDRFTELLDQLPEVRRHAFVLFRIEGLSHDEIAARLGISARSSERHVMMAMRHFAQHLEKP